MRWRTRCFHRTARESAEAKHCFGYSCVQASCEHVVVVSNDIFTDGVTYDAWTMRYLHALGRMNQLLAAQADWVVESVCGIPIVHKKRENI